MKRRGYQVATAPSLFSKKMLQTVTLASQEIGQQRLPPFILPHEPLKEMDAWHFDLYLSFVEQILRSLLPEETLLALMEPKSASSVATTVQALLARLPLFVWKRSSKSSAIASIAFLCPTTFTSGVEQYLADSLSRWLVPGKFLSICSSQSLHFCFSAFPQQSFFVQQVLIDTSAFQDLHHVEKILPFQFMFRKLLQQNNLKNNVERCVRLKLFKAKGALGILGGITILHEGERFEERHVLTALQRCLPKGEAVPDSFVLDRRSHDPALLFYIEVKKRDDSAFSKEEIRALRACLPTEIRESIESVVHPIFMPRNEEEILRHILILSAELRYIHDIPQVVISFDAQTETEVSFTIIALRLLKENTPALHTLLSSLRFDSLEIRPVGTLRKRYVKEASFFKVRLDKRPFLRKDHSLDLLKARHAVSSDLNRVFGGIRDFNGGILSKQQEVLQELHHLLDSSEKTDVFLLESFFYSIFPQLHQSLLPPKAVYALFQLLLEVRAQPLVENRILFRENSEHLFIMIASHDPTLKDHIQNSQIPSSDLTLAQLSEGPCHYIGCLYRSDDPAAKKNFYTALEGCIRRATSASPTSEKSS